MVFPDNVNYSSLPELAEGLQSAAVLAVQSCCLRRDECCFVLSIFLTINCSFIWYFHS